MSGYYLIVLTLSSPCSKTTLAVSSIEFCQCKFDECNVRKGLGGDSGHAVMIPLLSVGIYNAPDHKLRFFTQREAQFVTVVGIKS
jgi:hypothetical protein